MSGGGGGQFGGAAGRAKSRDSRLGLTTGKVTGKSAYGQAGGNAVGMGAPGHENPAATARTLSRMGMSGATWDGNKFVGGAPSSAVPGVGPSVISKVKQNIPVPGLSPAMLASIQAFLSANPTATSVPRSVTAPYTKSIYDRMPEYDRVPGYGEAPWSDIRPRMGNNLVNRAQTIGNPANGAPSGGPGYSWR